MPAWNQNLQMMACGSNQQGTVYMWRTDTRPDIATGASAQGNYTSKVTLFGDGAQEGGPVIRAIALSETGQYLAASNDRGNLKILDMMGDYNHEIIEPIKKVVKKRVEDPIVVEETCTVELLDQSSDSVVFLEELPPKKTVKKRNVEETNVRSRKERPSKKRRVTK
jgi:hypothetical protein